MTPQINRSIGDKLYSALTNTMEGIFQLGEQVQLSFSAYQLMHQTIDQDEDEVFTLSYPIGLRADGTQIIGHTDYPKEQLKDRYIHLADSHLSLTSIYSLVTWMETLFGDVIRIIILEFPKKLGPKRKVPLSSILSADSLESVHLAAADSLLNDLSYKSPRDFASEFDDITGINLLEIPAFHKYIEFKATRDIYLHNKGVASDVYLEKAGAFSRVKSGYLLPVNVQYFLSCYEASLQTCESLKESFHLIWYSSEYEAAQLRSSTQNDNTAIIET